VTSGPLTTSTEYQRGAKFPNQYKYPKVKPKFTLAVLLQYMVIYI